MGKNIFILIVIFSFINSAKAQQNFKSFTIYGTGNIDTGVIKLMQIDGEYYHKSSICDSGIIKNGKFRFNGSIDCPTGYRLRVEVNSKLISISDIFYVVPGIQNLTWDMQTPWNLPETNNALMTEQKEIFEPFQKAFSNTLPQDSVLLLYASKYPNSYLSLWKLIDNMAYGYKVIDDQIFIAMSNKVKTSFAGIVLEKKLLSSSTVRVGFKFPDITLLDTSLQKRIVLSSISNGYIFYDFWFTHCMPCISQFPDLKKIYAEYNQKGFRIVGILSDVIENTNEWKSLIRSSHLTWEHYLDLNLSIANEFSIKKFPTNYLMDKNGKIVAKDLSPAELLAFLNTHLN